MAMTSSHVLSPNMKQVDLMRIFNTVPPPMDAEKDSLKRNNQGAITGISEEPLKKKSLPNYNNPMQGISLTPQQQQHILQQQALQAAALSGRQMQANPGPMGFPINHINPTAPIHIAPNHPLYAHYEKQLLQQHQQQQQQQLQQQLQAQLLSRAQSTVVAPQAIKANSDTQAKYMSAQNQNIPMSVNELAMRQLEMSQMDLSHLIGLQQQQLAKNPNISQAEHLAFLEQIRLHQHQQQVQAVRLGQVQAAQAAQAAHAAQAAQGQQPGSRRGSLSVPVSIPASVMNSPLMRGTMNGNVMPPVTSSVLLSQQQQQFFHQHLAQQRQAAQAAQAAQAVQAAQAAQAAQVVQAAHAAHAAQVAQIAQATQATQCGQSVQAAHSAVNSNAVAHLQASIALSQAQHGGVVCSSASPSTKPSIISPSVLQIQGQAQTSPRTAQVHLQKPQGPSSLQHVPVQGSPSTISPSQTSMPCQSQQPSLTVSQGMNGHQVMWNGGVLQAFLHQMQEYQAQVAAELNSGAQSVSNSK